MDTIHQLQQFLGLDLKGLLGFLIFVAVPVLIPSLPAIVVAVRCGHPVFWFFVLAFLSFPMGWIITILVTANVSLGNLFYSTVFNVLLVVGGFYLRTFCSTDYPRPPVKWIYAIMASIILCNMVLGLTLPDFGSK